jgi:isochorismate pyruvate lyase
MSADIPKPIINNPEHCQTMAEVRAGVDDVDRALVALLARRFGYMDAAARIKHSRDAVRDEARKAQVIANVRKEVTALGLPEELLIKLWEDLVEGSIAFELDCWDNKSG